MDLRELIRSDKPAAIIKLLQQNNSGADAAAEKDHLENSSQGSALFYAIEINASKQILEILLENGYTSVIDRIRTIDSKNALEFAISLKRNDAALLLLRYGAIVQINLREPFDAAILRHAAKEGAFEFAKLYMQQKSIGQLLPIEVGPTRARSIHSFVRGACLSQKATEKEKVGFLANLLQYLAVGNVHYPIDLAAYVDELRYLKESAPRAQLVSEALRLGAGHENIDVKNFLSDPAILNLLLTHANQVFDKDVSRANAHDTIIEKHLFEHVRSEISLNILLDFYDVELEMDETNFPAPDAETEDPLPPSAIANHFAFHNLSLLQTFLLHPKIMSVNQESLLSTGKPIWSIADVIEVLRARHYVALATMLMYLPLSDENDLLGILEEPGFVRQDENRSIYVYFMRLAKPEFSEKDGGISNPDDCIARLQDFFHAFTIDREHDMHDLRLFESFMTRLQILIERFRSSAEKNHNFLNQMVERDAVAEAKLKKFSSVFDYSTKVAKLFDLVQEAANYVGATDDEAGIALENNAFDDRPVGILAPLIHARILKSAATDQPQPPLRYSLPENDPEHRFYLIRLGLVPFDVCIDSAKFRQKKTLGGDDGSASSWPIDSLLEVVTAAYYLCPQIDYFAVEIEELCRCLHNTYLPENQV